MGNHWMNFLRDVPGKIFLKSQLNNDTIIHICCNHWFEEKRGKRRQYVIPVTYVQFPYKVLNLSTSWGWIWIQSNSVTSCNNEHLSKLNNLQITHCRFAPVSFRIPASHYFRYVCPQCIIQVDTFLNLLSAVFTSDQPALQSAIIWNMYDSILQIPW